MKILLYLVINLFPLSRPAFHSTFKPNNMTIIYNSTGLLQFSLSKDISLTPSLNLSMGINTIKYKHISLMTSNINFSYNKRINNTIEFTIKGYFELPVKTFNLEMDNGMFKGGRMR